jgi:NCS1 family nucleobase:cation symporter-1
MRPLSVSDQRPSALAPHIDWPTPEQRAGSPRTLGAAWVGVMVAPGTIITGIFAAGGDSGPGFLWAVLGLGIGILAGCLGVAWLATYGPPWGLGTMFVGALAFGRANIVPVVALIISLFFYNALDDIFGAQSIHDAIGTPVMTMILAVFALELVVVAVGERLMRIGGTVMTVVVAIVALLLVAGIARQGIAPSAAAPMSFSVLEGILRAIALGLSLSITWGVQAADLSRTLPANTERGSVFRWTYAGMAIPLLLLTSLGAYISDGIATSNPLGRVSEVLGNHDLAVVILLLLCLSFALINGLNDYSAGLALQDAGVRVHRKLVSLGVAIVGLALAFVLTMGDTSSRVGDIIVATGYYTVCWFGVVAVELVLRRREARPWEIPAGAPVAAVLAFVGSLLLMIPFTATTIGNDLAMRGPVLSVIGSVPRHLTHGGGLGYEAGAVFSVVLYVALRRFVLRRDVTP